jgi:hypothetical protein
MTGVIRSMTRVRHTGGVKPPKLPLHPANPERICWGCDKYCRADDLACGNGTIRTLHPAELFGDDWLEWIERRKTPPPVSQPAV